MDSSVISGLIGGAIAVALVSYLSSRVRAAPATGQLRYGWFIALLGVCCLAVAAFAFWLLFLSGQVQEDGGAMLAAIVLLLGFGLGAGASFAEYFKVRGTYNEEEIDIHTPWTGRKHEKWEDLVSATFSSQMSWYVLTFKSGTKVRISSLLGGSGGVVTKLKEMGYDI